MEYLYIEIVNFVRGFFVSASDSLTWLLAPIDYLGISPLMFLSFNGLFLFLTIAIAKWIIS